MGTKNTEWKRVSLSKERLDLSGATHAELESDGDTFIALTLKLKSGKLIRLRKNNYDVSFEEPVFPMITKYVAKTGGGLQMTFDSESEAEKAISGIEDAEVTEISIPLEQGQIEDSSYSAATKNASIPF